MKELVRYLAKALVDDPAPVFVEQTGSNDDAILRLSVGRSDLGKVIGKKGRTAKALRTLLSSIGAKQNMRVTLEIVEPQENISTAADTESESQPGPSEEQ
jgi:uncharacterized protein